MARARSLKPGLFKNEILGVADPLLTLLFEGLWCLADREGRLEDRPVRIKGEIFPYRDGVDVNGDLTVLQRMGFIQRYKLRGVGLIQIVNFTKHQSPHHTEKPSVIPGPTPESLIPCGFEEITVKDLEQDGKITAPLPPDSCLLTPDSLVLTPSLEPTVLVKTAGALFPSDQVEEPAKPKRIDCPHQELLELFHKTCTTLPRVMKLNDLRRKHLAARWREVDDEARFADKADGLAVFEGIFLKVARSNFLSGRSSDWHATFDWLTQSSTNFLKVCEDHYHNDKWGQR